MLQRPIYAFDAVSRLFAMAVGAQKVRLWKMADVGAVEAPKEGVKPTAELELSRSALVGMAICVEGVLVTTHETGMVLGWDLQSIFDGDAKAVWELEAGIAVCAVASHRETRSGRHVVALGGTMGQIVMLELAGANSPQLARAKDAHGDKIEVLAFSDDDERLASSARDRAICIWSTEIDGAGEQEATLRQLRRLTGSDGWPLALAFSHDHRRLVSGAMDNGVYLWELDADDALKSVRFDHHGWVQDVTWTSDDKEIITASWDNSLAVYGAHPLQPRLQFSYHKDYVVRVLAIPDSSLVFAASYDGDVTVWDRQTGGIKAVLKGHGDWVSELVWLGEGQVASLSSDRTARVWSVDDLTLSALLGERLLESFELKGGFDLQSFGISSDDKKGAEEEAGPDLEALQHQVVRRFGSDDPFATAGSHKTAMSMLEEAVEQADAVDATVVTAEDMEIDADADAFLGDELSDMVLSAISDVEEPDELGADETGPMAADLPSQDVSSQDVGAEVDSVGDDALSMLDVPEIETASPADLDVESPEEDEATADAWSQSEAVDIMDSAFDPVPDVEGGEAGESADAESPEPDEGRQEVLPTSGPLYDPKPLGPEDDLDEILPGSGEIDLAFSSSASEVSDVSDDGAEDEEKVEEEAAAEEKERDVDREPDGDPGEEQNPPGKAEPSSAMGAPVEADGGDSNQWKRSGARGTLTNAKPLPGLADEESEPSPANPAPAKPAAANPLKKMKLNRAALKRMARKLDESLPAEEKPVVEKPVVEKTVVEEPVVEEPVDDYDAAAPTQLVSALGPADQQAPTQKIEKPKKKSEPKRTVPGGPGLGMRGESSEVDEAWGNSTQMWGSGAQSEPEQEEEESELAGRMSQSRQVNDFKRREKTLGGGRKNISLSDRLKLKKKELRARFAESNDDDADELPTPEQQPAEKLEQEKLVQETEAAADDAGPSSIRLKPGRPLAEEDLQVPEPEVSDAEVREGDPTSAALVKVSLDELWTLAAEAAPAMGVLKRSVDPGAEYEPVIQIKTEHQGPLRLALASNDRRLVSAGSKGSVEVWQVKGTRHVRFVVADGNLVEVGFLSGQNCLWALDRSAKIHLWALPRAALGQVSKVSHAVIDGGDSPFRCGSLVEKKRLLFTGSDDGKARLWSLEKGHCIGRLVGHTAPVSAVAVGQKGPITASVDGEIRFWDRKGLQVDQLETSGEVTDLRAFNGMVVWTEASGALNMIREGDSKPTRLKGHHGQGRSLEFRDNTHFVSGGEDGRILLYQVGDDSPAQEIQTPAPIHRLAISDKVLASASEGGTIFVFRRSSKKKKK